MAFRQLFDVTRATRYATIKCLIREPGSASNAFASMVEENEVRVGLSPYERGRIAGITVQMGVYASTEEAVNTLFAAASKAKRSKIRSFAAIFDELGDMLTFPEALSEKQGLRLSAALRGGGAQGLRSALADVVVESAAEEWGALEPIVTGFEDSARDETRGGRPAKKPRSRPQQSTTSTGFTIRREEDSRGYLLRITGRSVDADMMDIIVGEVTRRLEKPK
jgi:ParB family chromosome partitioning protein